MPSHAETRSKFARTPIAVAAACAALLGATSLASAADCVNGYRTLPHQIIQLCGDAAGLNARAELRRKAGAPAPRKMMVEDPSQCQPGLYWMKEWENGTALMRCR